MNILKTERNETSSLVLSQIGIVLQCVSDHENTRQSQDVLGKCLTEIFL